MTRFPDADKVPAGCVVRLLIDVVLAHVDSAEHFERVLSVDAHAFLSAVINRVPIERIYDRSSGRELRSYETPLAVNSYHFSSTNFVIPLGRLYGGITILQEMQRRLPAEMQPRFPASAVVFTARVWHALTGAVLDKSRLIPTDIPVCGISIDNVFLDEYYKTVHQVNIGSHEPTVFCSGTPIPQCLVIVEFHI
ncbi:unnamed protein product [Caenorhabditis auriculariae]|uniref:Uncharacterized protein n=1 Tax=Caenorhabditis auriculariae TaxID=2777116 RepID=A0A8S1HD09_9PELO|nr:unnamed protein product [Caenorhabditis auriculariae]